MSNPARYPDLEGQTVVIDGHSRLRNGLKIAISGGPAKSGG